MWKKSTISNKYPTYRDIRLKSTLSWLAGKRIDDNAESLWRIHDSLYDFSDFVDRHPGGPDWLKLTKGTDITEAFEAHHISIAPMKMLEKFKIRDASKPRNIILTFEENGFYKTLKTRVRNQLPTLDYKPSRKSDLIHTFLLISTFLTSIACVIQQSIIIGMIASLFLTWTVIASHNYFHKADNWRMYAFNLSLMNYQDWRISHALSHHLFPNSFHDLELSMFEPFFCWIPNSEIKNIFQRYASWIYGPIVYASLYGAQFVKKIVYSFAVKNIFNFSDIIAFSIPILMFIFSGASFLVTLKMYITIMIGASYLFGLIGINAAHHQPNIIHDGDELRKNLDWGIYQLDAVMDCSDFKRSQFICLTHFGDHALHHLFPTLDHGVLPQLYSTLYETLAEFEGELRETNWITHIIGQHKQLARIKPCQFPPSEKKSN